MGSSDAACSKSFQVKSMRGSASSISLFTPEASSLSPSSISCWYFLYWLTQIRIVGVLFVMLLEWSDIPGHPIGRGCRGRAFGHQINSKGNRFIGEEGLNARELTYPKANKTATEGLRWPFKQKKVMPQRSELAKSVLKGSTLNPSLHRDNIFEDV